MLIYTSHNWFCFSLSGSPPFSQARNEYTNLCDSLLAEQERLTLSQLPQILEMLRETSENMVSVIHTAIDTFENLQSSLVGNSKVWKPSNPFFSLSLPSSLPLSIPPSLPLSCTPLFPSLGVDVFCYVCSLPSCHFYFLLLLFLVFCFLSLPSFLNISWSLNTLISTCSTTYDMMTCLHLDLTTLRSTHTV